MNGEKLSVEGEKYSELYDPQCFGILKDAFLKRESQTDLPLHMRNQVK